VVVPAQDQVDLLPLSCEEDRAVWCICTTIQSMVVSLEAVWSVVSSQAVCTLLPAGRVLSEATGPRAPVYWRL